MLAILEYVINTYMKLVTLIQFYAPFHYFFMELLIFLLFNPINFRSETAGGCIFNSCVVAGFGP